VAWPQNCSRLLDRQFAGDLAVRVVTGARYDGAMTRHDLVTGLRDSLIVRSVERSIRVMNCADRAGARSMSREAEEQGSVYGIPPRAAFLTARRALPDELVRRVLLAGSAGRRVTRAVDLRERIDAAVSATRSAPSLLLIVFWKRRVPFRPTPEVARCSFHTRSPARRRRILHRQDLRRFANVGEAPPAPRRAARRAVVMRRRGFRSS